MLLGIVVAQTLDVPQHGLTVGEHSTDLLLLGIQALLLKLRQSLLLFSIICRSLQGAEDPRVHLLLIKLLEVHHLLLLLLLLLR